MLSLKHRSTEKEIFDLETPDISETWQAYRLIQLINRFTGGTRVILSHFKKFSQKWAPKVSIHILDVGTGSCDIPIAIIKWTRKQGWNVKITALDISSQALTLAQKELTDYPEINLIQGDIFKLPFQNGSFDYCISSMFFHHLSDEEIPQALKALDSLAKRGILINDLLRKWQAYLGIKILCAFITNRAFRNDAPLSVLRGFRENEVGTSIKKAGLNYLLFYEHFGYRFALAGEKSSSQRLPDGVT